MSVSQQFQSEERDSSSQWLEAIFQNTPSGLLLLDGRRIRLLNPAARRLLGLSEKAEGQSLALDGPDGLLAERITEALARAKGSRAQATFAYRVPLPTARQERSLKITALRMAESRPAAKLILLQIEEADEIPLDHSHWQEAIRHAFHEMKTPLAVFSLGLSNLSAYYERLSDEQRRSMIDDLAEQANEMTHNLATLFGQIRTAIGAGKPPKNGKGS